MKGRLDSEARERAPSPVPETCPYPMAAGRANTGPRWRTVLLVVLPILVVLLAGGSIAAYLAGTPAEFAVHGILSLAPVGGTCRTFDVGPWQHVTVAAEDGTILGVGRLTAGESCQWDFTVKHVSAGHRSYGVTVDGRVTVRFSERQLRAGVTLGPGLACVKTGRAAGECQ